MKKTFLRSFIPTLLLLLMLWQPARAANAPADFPQNHAVSRIFKKYARHKSASLVNLEEATLKRKGGEVFGVKGLKRMITLTLKNPTAEMVKDVQQVITQDKRNSDDIQEVYDSGYLVSAYYRLDVSGANSSYLLYRYDRNRNHIILIYMQGEIDSEELLNLLHGKK